MSSYFRGLAAQALGLGVSVKSAARLAHAAVPMIFEQPTGDEAAAPLAAARTASVARSNATDRPSLTEAKNNRTASSLPFPPANHPAVSASFAQPTYDTDNERRPVHTMRGAVDQNPTTLSMNQPAVSEPADYVESSRVPALPPLVPIATRFVLSPAFASASPGSARTANAYRHSTDGDATEVHVSIGRIEVTAINEALPPPRRAVPVNKSMPLSEYLAKRHRGRP